MSNCNMSCNPNYKTSVCKYAYIGCKQQNKCWYAHNKNEIRIRYCTKGMSCDDKTCCYLHPNQSFNEDEYYLKVLFKSDIIGLDKNCLKQQMDFIINKFIIEIDTDSVYNFDNNEIDKHNNNEDRQLSINLDEHIENNDDKELENYIKTFEKEWNINSNQFYEQVNENKNINLNINANDSQIEKLLMYLKTMNIEFEIKN